jgi:hypothetical protein
MAESEHELTLTGNIRRLSNEMMCDWRVTAWNMVLTKIIMKSFSKTGITDALEGNKDDMWAGDKNVDVEENSESMSDSSSEQDHGDE